MTEERKKRRPAYLKLVHSKAYKPPVEPEKKIEEVEVIDFHKPSRGFRDTMNRKGIDLKTITMGIGALCIMCASIAFMLTVLLLAST